MLRWRATGSALPCLVLALAACPGPGPKAVDHASHQLAVDEVPARLRVARAEAKRSGGIAELAELAAHGAPHERLLALRGLGRIGGATAVAALRTRLADPDPAIVAAAASAIGIAASLDDTPGDEALTAELAAAIPRAAERAPLVIEALGRAGARSAQAGLAALVDKAGPEGVAAANALGRHGRRKLALDDNGRAALRRAVASSNRDLAYMATWALAREHEPPALSPADPPWIDAAVRAGGETAAQAFVAIAKRHWARELGEVLRRGLAAADWRIATEAIRAFATDLEGSWPEAVAAAVAARLPLIDADPAQAHVAIEGLVALERYVSRGSGPALADILQRARSTNMPALARGWIVCRATLALERAKTDGSPDSIARCSDAVPEHLRLALVASYVEGLGGTVATRVAAVGTLVTHADPRVRAAGLSALATRWSERDAADQRTAAMLVANAIGLPDPIVAGAAVEALPVLLAQASSDDRAVIEQAVVARAAKETDVELATALLELIGKRAISAGADVCRAALVGHPVRARAAATCLAGLGEAAAVPLPTESSAPPIDVALVIGKRVRWTLATERGDIVIALRPDVAPWAVATIATLARRGFYNGLQVHRVVPDFVAQGGDPTQSGWGGPGFMLPAEPADLSVPGFVAGGVGIADAGRDSGGSQWFVMHARAPHLDGRYTWVGTVESGQKSADALLIGDKVLTTKIEIVP